MRIHLYRLSYVQCNFFQATFCIPLKTAIHQPKQSVHSKTQFLLPEGCILVKEIKPQPMKSSDLLKKKNTKSNFSNFNKMEKSTISKVVGGSTGATTTSTDSTDSAGHKASNITFGGGSVG